MKGSLRWPRPSFVCVICFLCGGCFITSWLRSKQRSPLTRCPILPCWGLHLAPSANSQSQVISTAQIEEQHTGVVNVQTSSATPERKAASSFSVDDRPGSPFARRSAAGVHAFPQSTAVSSTGKKRLKSTANTVAESPTSERISLRESLLPQDKSFFEGRKLGGRLPFRYHRASYENEKNTNLQSFFDRDKPKFGHGSELGSPTSVARNGRGGVLDLLSPAHLLHPEDYADSLIAEVHGTFTEKRASTQQGINEKDAGVQSLLAEGTCDSTGNSGTGCDRKHSKPTNSDTSEVVRQRNQKVSTTAASRSEKNPTAVSAIAARVEGVGEAFNEQEQSGGCDVKNKLGLSGGRVSSGGFSDGPSFLKTLQKVKWSRGTVGGRGVLYAHASVPFAFAQKPEVRTSSRLQQKPRGRRAAGALAADLTALHVADVVSVRHADLPIAAHADALLQRPVSAGEDEEGNEATKGGKGRGADTGKIECKEKRHNWSSRSVLLHRGGAVLAPEKSHNNQREKEARTAVDITRELNREHHSHRLKRASLLGTSSEISAVKNVDTVTSQEKCAGCRAGQARETTKEAGGGPRPALVETAEGGGSEEEPEEEEEGEEFGESATAGEEEAASGKGKAGETAEGKAAPEAAAAAAAKEAAEKVGGEVEAGEEAASKKEHEETYAEVTEAAAATKVAGAPEAPPAESGTTEVTETEIAPTTEIESKGEIEGEEEVSAEKGKEEAKPAKEHYEEETEEKTVTLTIVTEGKKPGERPEKHEIVKKFETGSKEAGKLVEKWKKIAEELSEKHAKKEGGAHARAGEKTEHKVGAEEEAAEEAKKEATEQKVEKLEETALERQHRAEKKLEEPAEMLEEHRLSRGGPRGVTPFRNHSYVNAQDELQHKQLQQASEMATRLTKHLQRQNELKVQEMHLKRREMAHINQLHHFEQALQAVISNVWKKLDTLRGSLQRMTHQTKVIGEKILRRTGHRVLRPEEAPVTLHPMPAERQQIVAKTSRGAPQGECPTDCLPSACDNKPATPTQCFKYTESAGGGGYRTCEPFSDPDTATCPRGFTRCAMAAPVRGSHYELFESTVERPLPQPLLIHGANLSACLRLLTVHEQTKCSPDSSQVVEETMKDAQSVRAQPAPHVLEENAVLFEDVQVPKVGNYKICLLQYWVPPGAKKGDKVYVLGIDEVGTLTVLPQPDDTVLAKLLKAEEEGKEKEKAAKEKEEEGKDKEADEEKKEAHAAEERKEEKEKEAQEKMVEAATADGEEHAK